MTTKDNYSDYGVESGQPKKTDQRAESMEPPLSRTTKTICLWIYGQEIVNYSRQIVVEAPIDVTEEEIEQMSSDEFDDIPEPPGWEMEDSEGIYGEDTTVTIIGEAPQGDEADARLYWDDADNLVVEAIQAHAL